MLKVVGKGRWGAECWGWLEGLGGVEVEGAEKKSL